MGKNMIRAPDRVTAPASSVDVTTPFIQDVALLTDAGLPIDGVPEHFSSFFVVDDGGKIVGAAGLELYGEHALLRSVVVSGTTKGDGRGDAAHAPSDRRSVRARGTIYLTEYAFAQPPS
jgi:hypothetical protein